MSRYLATSFNSKACKSLSYRVAFVFTINANCQVHRIRVAFKCELLHFRLSLSLLIFVSSFSCTSCKNHFVFVWYMDLCLGYLRAKLF